MEKLLAMSFISAPMDFSGPSWVRARLASSSRPSTRTTTPAVDEKRDCSTGHIPPCRDTSSGGGGKHEGSNKARPHLALEFDGLNCFETFVFH